jgi:hypothetical protein
MSLGQLRGTQVGRRVGAFDQEGEVLVEYD